MLPFGRHPCLQLRNSVQANRVYGLTQCIDIRAKPEQFFLADTVVLRIASLNVRLFQLFKQSAVFAPLAWPSID